MLIAIVEYDPRWPDAFRALALPLRAVLGNSVLRIDHIGSTAVRDLPAKDIIDIQVTVANLEEPLDMLLAPFGYTRYGEIISDHRPPLATGPDSDWEKRYFRPPPAMRAMHLHVRAAEHPNQRYPLLFRDYLRVHPRATGGYAALKRAIAHFHPGNMDIYSDIKDPACDIIIAAAEDWATASGWKLGPTDA